MPLVRFAGCASIELFKIWDATVRTFRAARAAREWAYTQGPDHDELGHIEDDREALRRFQRSRQRRRTRKTKRTLRPANENAHVPARRSSRKKKRKRNDENFYWNFNDVYVLALDEYTAPTGRSIHTAIADRTLRKRLCKLV